jgi:hypothetical protein
MRVYAMKSYELNGPHNKSLSVVHHYVTPLDRHALDIEHIRSISGPMSSDGTVLEPGELRAEVYIRASGIEATLVYASLGGSRHLTGIQSMRPRRSRSLTTKAIASIPTRAVSGELSRLLTAIQEGAQGSADGLGAVGAAAEYVPRSPGKRKSVNKSRLLDIAVQYVEHEGNYWAMTAQPGSAAFSFSSGYVRQLVADARKAKLLQPTSAGKKNPELTPKARRMLAVFGKDNGEDNGNGY